MNIAYLQRIAQLTILISILAIQTNTTAQTWPQENSPEYRGPFGSFVSCSELEEKVMVTHPVAFQPLPNRTEYKFKVRGKQYTYNTFSNYFIILDRFRVFMAACPTPENSNHWWANEWTQGDNLIRISRGRNDSGKPRVFLTYEQFEPRNGMVFEWYSHSKSRQEFVSNSLDAYTFKYVPDNDSIEYHSIKESESWAMHPDLIPNEFRFKSDLFSWLHKK